jgi:hypothetical protein
VRETPFHLSFWAGEMARIPSNAEVDPQFDDKVGFMADGTNNFIPFHFIPVHSSIFPHPL